MKKIITSKNVLQLVLAGFAYISFGNCYEIGNKYEDDSGRFYPVKNSKYQRIFTEPTDITSQSGFNGGALGMGIICASCIMGIVFIETSKK